MQSSPALSEPGADRDAGALREAAAAVQAVARALRGPLGAGALVAEPVASAGVRAPGRPSSRERLVAIEARLDAPPATTTEDADDIEARNAALVACKDAVWALQWDRLATARAIEDLAGRGPLGRGRARRRTTRSRSRCRRSTGSRCAVVTPPACTCSSPVTISTSPTPTSRG